MLIGKRIRDRRTKLALSRRDLAAMILTRDGKPQSPDQIAHWETGRQKPMPDRRSELADALQTTVGDLFGEPEDATLLKRIDLLEHRVDAVIILQGIGDAVDARVRQSQRMERQEAQAKAKEAAKLNQAERATREAAPPARRPAPKRRRKKAS